MTGSARRRTGEWVAHTSPVTVLIPLLIVVLSTPGVSHGFDPDRECSVTVIGHVPERVAARVELGVQDFEIAGAQGVTSMAPSVPSVDVALRGAAPFEWARGVVAPGIVDSLRLRFDAAEVRIGEVSTRVDLQGVVASFPLGRALRPGECLVVHLLFDPDATPIDAEQWRPVVRRLDVAPVPLGQRMYVAQATAGTVAVLDRRSGDLVHEIGVGGEPRDLAWSELERRLFVAVAGRDEIVAVESGEADRLVRIPLRFGDRPTRMLVSGDEQDLWVVASARDALISVSPRTLQETGRVTVDLGPVALAEDSRAGRVFVSCESSRAILVVDTQSRTVVDRHVVRDVPGELVFLAETGQLLVSSASGRSVERIDAGTGATVESTEFCGPVRGLAYQERSGRAYVASAMCREITVVRPDLSIEVGNVRLDADPGHVRLDPEARMLLVPLPGVDAVLLVNTNRTQRVTRYAVGPRPVAVVVP